MAVPNMIIRRPEKFILDSLTIALWMIAIGQSCARSATATYDPRIGHEMNICSELNLEQTVSGRNEKSGVTYSCAGTAPSRNGATNVIVAMMLGIPWLRRVLAGSQDKGGRETLPAPSIQQYDTFTQLANDIIVLLDPDGTIVNVNERASEAYGYSEEQMVGMTISQIRAPETST